MRKSIKNFWSLCAMCATFWQSELGELINAGYELNELPISGFALTLTPFELSFAGYKYVTYFTYFPDAKRILHTTPKMYKWHKNNWWLMV